MSPVRKYMLAFSLVCVAVISHAAAPLFHVVSGTVVSESLEPIAGTSVTVRSAVGTVVLGNALSDAEGNYRVEISSEADIVVEAIHEGYEAYVSQPAPATDRVMNICLIKSALSIDEVVVTGMKPLVRMQDGNLVVDATQIHNAESMTLERLLDRLPGVSTQQGLTLNGRGATLYIDGVRQQTGAESAMRALSGAVVGEVELLSMPTAEYGVTSETVINVKTKKRGWDGYYLSLVAAVGRNRNGPLNNYDNVVMVFKKRNITFNTMLSFDTTHESHSQTDTTWYAAGMVLDRELAYRERLNTVQFLGNLNWESKMGHSLNLNTYIYDDHGRIGIDRRTGESLAGVRAMDKSHTATRGHDDLYSARLEYRSPDTLRTSVVLSYGLLYGGKRSTNDYLAGEVPLQYMDSQLDMTGYMHTLKGRLKQDVGKQRNLSLYAGFNATFGKLSDKADYNVTATPSDNTRSRFTGRENALDLYVQAHYKLSRRWSVQGYFTATYTDYDLDLRSEELHTRSNYWRYFPYTTISFNVKNYQGTLGFTTSMTRPEYEWMLPGVRYADRYSYTVGNPDLAPVIRKNLVWNNLLFDYATFQVSYSKIENISGSVMERRGDDQTVYTYRNYADLDRFRVYTSIPYELFDGKLSGELAAAYTYGVLRRSRNGFIAPAGRNRENVFSSRLDIYYAFTDSFSAECWLGYDTPWRTIQSTRENMYQFGLGATYKCLNNRLSLAVNLYDVLGLHEKDMNCRNYFDGNYQRVYWMPGSSPRRVELSARWSFNKGEKVSNRAKDIQMDSEWFGTK